MIGASLGVGLAVAGAAIGAGASVGTAAELGATTAAVDYTYGSYRAREIEQGDENELEPGEAGYARAQIARARALRDDTTKPNNRLPGAAAYMQVDGQDVAQGTAWPRQYDPQIGWYQCAEGACIVGSRGLVADGADSDLYLYQVHGRAPCPACQGDLQIYTDGVGGSTTVYYNDYGGDLGDGTYRWQRYYPGYYGPRIHPGWWFMNG